MFHITTGVAHNCSAVWVRWQLFAYPTVPPGTFPAIIIIYCEILGNEGQFIVTKAVLHVTWITSFRISSILYIITPSYPVISYAKFILYSYFTRLGLVEFSGSLFRLFFYMPQDNYLWIKTSWTFPKCCLFNNVIWNKAKCRKKGRWWC